ncbi:hypothetical protein ACWDSJ_13055 [Nocardia sp. NPDC003482]
MALILETMTALSNVQCSHVVNPPAVVMQNVDPARTVWIHVIPLAGPGGWRLRPGETLTIPLKEPTTLWTYTEAPADNSVNVWIMHDDGQ